MDVRRITLAEWADERPDVVDEVFHTPEALAVLDDHATGELHLYGGFKGQELAGVLPAFVRRYPGLTAVLSPPPGVSVSRLGPLVMPTSPKRRKRERLNRRFTEALLEAINADDPLTAVGIVSSTGYTDPRPYADAGFDVEPRFTYSLDLRDADEDAVRSAFTRDLRTEIRKLEEVPLAVSVGGADAALAVYDGYARRFAEQGADFPTPRPYTRELVAALGQDARVYSVSGPDGEFIGGVTVLYSDTTAYFWQGGMRADYQGLSVNSLLHWRIIQDVLADPALEGIERYDLGRAGVERLGPYKSKFGPDLLPYYEMKSGRLMALAKKAYNRIAY